MGSLMNPSPANCPDSARVRDTTTPCPHCFTKTKGLGPASVLARPRIGRAESVAKRGVECLDAPRYARESPSLSHARPPRADSYAHRPQPLCAVVVWAPPLVAARPQITACHTESSPAVSSEPVGVHSVAAGQFMMRETISTGGIASAASA